MISKSTKTQAEKERMKNIFEPIFMDNAMKYFETGLPCCFGDINIDGKDFGVFGLIVWSDDKIVGVEAFVGGMDLDCEIEKLWYDFVHNRFRDMLENYNGVRYYYPANNTDEAMEFASRMVYDEAAGYRSAADAGYEDHDVPDAGNVHLHLQQLLIRFELLLLHLRFDQYLDYDCPPQDNQ